MRIEAGAVLMSRGLCGREQGPAGRVFRGPGCAREPGVAVMFSEGGAPDEEPGSWPPGQRTRAGRGGAGGGHQADSASGSTPAETGALETRDCLGLRVADVEELDEPGHREQVEDLRVGPEDP